MTNKLVAKDICKKYGDSVVLHNINLEVISGEIVAIVGESGAGKSTLLKILATFLKPTSGSIIIDGSDIVQYHGDHLAKFRNKHIGFVFQENNLLPELSVLENVCLPRYIGGQYGCAVTDEAKKILDMLGILHHYDHKPYELSGGEQQRTAIARALINKPDIIFADEPSGNLDLNNAKKLHELFLQLRQEIHQTFLIVTHNQNLAQLSDRQIVIKDGTIYDHCV